MPQDDPQWENMLKMHYLQTILGKNTEIFHSSQKFRILKSLLKTSPVERFMILRTKLLKYLSEKQTFCTMGGRLGRLLLGSHADGSRKMYEVHVSGLAISSDKSPE